mmetsp:Transcript_13707/g.18821  ORF Transcript_13707/g.18821 Transcript_13707/m.18821 type:complete len:566 (+) Transcript_13707:94-1791(+)
MLTILKTYLPTETPIIGCQLKPYVLLRRADSTVFTDDGLDGIPGEDNTRLKSRWYRSGGARKDAVCVIHTNEPATIQCVGCLRAKVPIQKSYHCSQKCFLSSWPDHKNWHANPGNTEAPPYGLDDDVTIGSSTSEGWVLLGMSRWLTPSLEEVGCVLKLEVVVVARREGGGEEQVGAVTTLLTPPVLPLAPPLPRKLHPIQAAPAHAAQTNFSLMSYNILADLYATSEMYSSCPKWALHWDYRKQSILHEIINQHPDIVCLQEVQSDHYEQFFLPEMQNQGYTAVYKTKTASVYTGSLYTIDGCATFFRSDRFSLVKKYEVEFNKAALSLSDALSPANQTATLSRLLKDNVALIVVLDFIKGAEEEGGARQLVCVANTHILANPELKDVKLWQVHTLLKGLEKIAVSANIPMLVTGDFNSVPGSAPHSLLAHGRVEASHPELATDPLGILRPPTKLSHQLPLMSAYNSMATPGLATKLGQEVVESGVCQVDSDHHEPLFTHVGADFTGTLDYIFYTANSLTPTKLLELPDLSQVQINGHRMPNTQWPSDHLAIMAEFMFKPQEAS